MVDHLTIEVDDDNDDSFPYLLKESYIQQHESLRISYKACHDIIQQLSEDKVKDIAKEHRIYYNPIDECNSQRYYNVDWVDDIYPKLQRDVARYFCAKREGVKYLSKYVNANEEEAAEMEVEVDGMDLEMETSRKTISDSNNVDKEEEVSVAAATSAVHFKPIANAENEQDADMQMAGSGDAEDDNLDFGGGGCDDSFDVGELDSTHIKENKQQSTVGVALDAPEPDIEVLEESDVKEAARTKTKSPTSVGDTAVFDSEVEEEQQQEVEQHQQPKKKFQCPHCKKKYVYEKSYNNHIDVCKKKPSPPKKKIEKKTKKKDNPKKKIKHNNATQPIPSNVPAKVESVEVAKERLDKLMKFKIAEERAVNEDERKEICAARDYMYREIERAFGVLSDDYRENLTPWDGNKKIDDEGLYDLDLGEKVGEAKNLDGRTNMQMPKYTTRSIISNPASEEVVQEILNLSLLMLKGHDPTKIEKTKSKIRRQVGEAIIHACYMVKGNVVLEFVLQMPTDRVREMIDVSPFIKSLRKNPQYERLKILFGRCNSVMDADTWATILSFLYENSEHIEHLLPQLDEHITKWLCKMNVDQDKYSHLVNLHPLSPYYEHNKQDILDMLKLVRDSSINNGEKAARIHSLLAKIHARDHHEEPTKEEAAVAGVQTLTNIFNTPQSTSEIIRVRQCSLDAIKSCSETAGWFKENMKPSTAIELKCTKVEARSEAGVSTIGSNNGMTVYETKSGHVILARKSSWPMFGNPIATSLHDAFIATRGYMDESALMQEFDFLSSDGLNRIIDLMLSHTMLLTGLNGSLYGAINNKKNGGSINNSKSYTLPRGVGGKGGQPPGIPSVQSTVFGGLYMYAIIQIYKMSIETHPNKTDDDFNKLAAIVTGNDNFIGNGTPLTRNSKCPGLKAVGNLPARKCDKVFGSGNLPMHYGKRSLGGGMNQIIGSSCGCTKHAPKYELEMLRVMEVRDQGQQIRFDLLTATHIDNDKEKIKQCKLLEKEEKQRLKNEGKEQEQQLAKKRKRTKVAKQLGREKKRKQLPADQRKREKEANDEMRDLINPDPRALSGIEKAGPNDVMTGRGGGTNHHPGNIKFRRIVEDLKPTYQASTRSNKPVIAMKIVSDWRSLNPPGRFLAMNKNTGLWDDIGDESARNKCSQALREKHTNKLWLNEDGKSAGFKAQQYAAAAAQGNAEGVPTSDPTTSAAAAAQSYAATFRTFDLGAPPPAENEEKV